MSLHELCKILSHHKKSGSTEVENSPSVLAVMWVFSLFFFPVLLRPSDMKGGSVKVMDYPVVPMTATSILFYMSDLV